MDRNRFASGGATGRVQRRALLAAAGCALLPLSGCTAEPGVNGGLLEVLEADAPPEATVTPPDDERIRDADPVQTALDRASERGTADLRLDESRFAAAAAALTPLPWYERSGGARSPSGIYLGHRGSTYVASLWPYCAGSALGSAESERGVYGRGGCLDPEERPGNP